MTSLSGLRTELDIRPDHAWARTIASQRAQVADPCVSRSTIFIPGRVRRMLRVREADEIRLNSALDAR